MRLLDFKNAILKNSNGNVKVSGFYSKAYNGLILSATYKDKEGKDHKDLFIYVPNYDD